MGEGAGYGELSGRPSLWKQAEQEFRPAWYTPEPVSTQQQQQQTIIKAVSLDFCLEWEDWNRLPAGAGVLSTNKGSFVQTVGTESEVG